MSTLAYILIAVISYFIGTINFAKIISWYSRHKDITKVGSGNPGTMNMLRSFGFKLALFTFLAEIVKAGVTALVCKIIIGGEAGDLAFWYSGLFLLLGYNFPFWYKGGKGAASFAGLFLFSNLWYVAIAWLVVCVILLCIHDYASVNSFLYLTMLAVAHTIYIWVLNVPYAWVLTAIIWALVVLIYIRHHANIYRLIHHKENKVGFKEKAKKFFCHKKGEEIIDESEVNLPPEEEIVIEEDETQANEEIVIDDDKK